MRAIWKKERATRSLVRTIGLMIAMAVIAPAANWQLEMVDQTATGKFSSLKIDKLGNAHLAYVLDDSRATLRYAFWDHKLKRWFRMDLAQGASFCSLVLDSQDHPRISWADAGTVPGCKLRYAQWDGKAWNQQAVPLPAETVAYYTSLVLDANDYPSISFYEYDGPRGTTYRVRMRVVMWNGQFWQVSTVDGDNQSGKFNSMAVDKQGHLLLAYANVNAGTAGMRFGFWDGSTWHREEADGRDQNNLGYVGHAVCIVLDREGDPHLTYMNTSISTVKYAVRKNGHWTAETVEQLGGIGYPDRNSIVLDDEDRPYLSYYDAGRGLLRVAHRDGQNWVAETVDGNSCGYTSSLALHDGEIWVSYADEGTRGIKVAQSTLAEVRGKSLPVAGAGHPVQQSRKP